MMYRTLKMIVLAAVVALPATTATALAQQGGVATWSVARGDGPNVFYQEGDGMAPVRAEFISAEMAFDGDVVKGAPYSADAVTESVHTLADGNRIVNTTHSKVFRDSEGRSRREQSLMAVGPWSAEGTRELVVINDPVSGASFIIDPDKKTAHKMSMPRVIVERVPAGEAKAGADTAPTNVRTEKTIRVVAAAGEAGDVATVDVQGPRTIQVTVNDEKPAKEESLGKRTIEGVECEGTRQTSTIAAGEIGNERAIDIVSERWYSPELKTVVLSTHSDPRFGETSFRLTNIDRSEPDKTLFELPAGVTIDKSNEPTRVVQYKRQVEKKS